jgi:hypothetical protein
MKRLLAVVLACVIGCAFVACSKGGRPSDVFNRMKGFTGTNIEDASAFYTKGTMEAIREMQKLMPAAQQKKSDNKFTDARWDVVEEKITGDTATVKLKFTDHAVANMKGTEAVFRLKKEDGVWKLDMEQEMRIGLQAMKGMGNMAEMLKQLKAHK